MGIKYYIETVCDALRKNLDVLFHYACITTYYNALLRIILRVNACAKQNVP